MRCTAFSVVAATLLLGTAVAHAASPAQVEIADLPNNQFKMNFQVEVQASSSAVWGALTDYDHQAEFLPYLTRSQIVFRNWDYAIVDQEGKVKWLFWTFKVWVQQKVSEIPGTGVRFQAVQGDFAHLQGLWSLQAMAKCQTRLTCELVMQPKRHVPAWAVRWAARKYLGGMVAALARAAEQHQGPACAKR